MDDKHILGAEGDASPPDDDKGDPAAELAALDPADAPEAAERYAADLATELEEAGGPAAPPVQLRADLDTPDATRE